eukprot:5774524-Pyramimonas_sp.AAC.1
MIARRALMIQIAVKNNPRNPGLDGLRSHMSRAFDASGGVVASKFDAEMAERRRIQAIIMKSERLLKEDHEADHKR